MYSILDLWKILVSSYFVSIVSSKTEVTSNSEVKSSLIEDIVHKVCNVSLEELAMASPGVKAQMLVKIEENLQTANTSLALGQHSDKYVTLIMEGIILHIFGDHSKNFRTSETKTVPNLLFLRDSTNVDTKKQMSETIYRKLKLLLKPVLSKKSERRRSKDLRQIYKKLHKKFIMKHEILHKNRHETKPFLLLISQGINAVMNEAYKNRRISKKHRSKQRVNKYSNKTRQVADMRKNMQFTSNDDDEFSKQCDKILNKTCEDINFLSSVPCRSGGGAASVEALCDGVSDCLDHSDEQKCAKMASEKIHHALKIMTNLEYTMSGHCSETLTDATVLSMQNGILRNILHRQKSFVDRHTAGDANTFKEDTPDVMASVNDIALVISAISSSLKGAICDPAYRKIKRSVTTKPDDNILTSKWQASSCKCNDQNCMNFPNCAPQCQQMCSEKYALGRWTCVSMNGESSVSLDYICDGKIDCSDDSDEAECSIGDQFKHIKSRETFNHILGAITTRSKSEDSSTIRNKLIVLRGLVLDLQKLSMTKNASIALIKYARDTCFAEIISIHNQGWLESSAASKVQDMYFFLQTLNDKLVSALKLSYSGNEKIVSPDGCYCRDYACAAPVCSATCVRACLAEPKFTRYFCGRSPAISDSVAIDTLCDGKRDCPNGDDEDNCKKDVCLSHHLTLLRHKLREVGDKEKGTSVGEALISWKEKVIKELSAAEKSGRPAPRVMRQIIQTMLQDLVSLYAELGNRRSLASTDNAKKKDKEIFNEFHRLSQVITDTLRSCSQ